MPHTTRTALAAATPSRCRADAGGQDDHVEAAIEIPCVQRLRKDDFERDFELLQQPARPARWHGTAVLIGQRDPHLAKLDGIAGGSSRDASEVDAEISRMGDPVPPLFWLRDPDDNTLMVVEV